MALYRLPNIETKKWNVKYIGEFFGDIIRGFNLDLFSDKGKVKTGKKVYPHTIDQKAYSFFKAISGRLWTILENKISMLEMNKTAFEDDDMFGFATDETVGEKNDILTVKDESDAEIETTPINISNNAAVKITGESQTKKWAQLITKVSGPFRKLTIGARKEGTLSDNLKVAIQEDSNGIPSGTDLISVTISNANLASTFVDKELEDTDFNDDLRFEIEKKYWIVFSRTGSADATNYFEVEVNVATTDPYGNGRLILQDEDNNWESAILREIVDTFTANGNWTVPAGVTKAIVECWAAGGGGSTNVGAGGGGAYSKKKVTGLTPGQIKPVVVGTSAANTDGGDSTFDATVVVAKGGKSGTNGGAGGDSALGTGDTKFSGGSGGNGTGDQNGGGGAGDKQNGGNATTGDDVGEGGEENGGDGAHLGTNSGLARPLGGGGRSAGAAQTAGERGEVRITYYVVKTTNFPYIAERTYGRGVSTDSSTVFTAPKTAEPGDLLLLMFSVSGAPTVTTPTGWTQLQSQVQSTNATQVVYYRRATLNDGGTLSWGVAQRSAYCIYRIANAATPAATNIANATSGSIGDADPPNLDFGGLAKKRLWIALATLAELTVDASVVDGAPTNYDSLITISATRGTQSASIMQAVADRELEASSENPGTFNMTDRRWIASTIGIEFEDTRYKDAAIRVDGEYPEAEERVYVTTSKDVLFLNETETYWESLWRGILQRDNLDNAYPAILKNLEAGGTLLLANGNKVHTFIATANSISEVTENRLIFEPEYFINWVRITTNAVFIGLQNKLFDLLPSQVVYYEPFAERTRTYTIEEGATMGFIINENCHIIDKMGQIRSFTGASFQPYNYFPPYYRDEKMTKLPHRNAVFVKGNIVKFLWEGQYPDPAGVWVLEDGNLYHKHSFVFDKTTLNSLGAMEVSEFGALYETENPSLPHEGTEKLFAGAGVSDGDADIKGIYSTIQTSVADDQRAQLITSKFITPELEETWQDIAIKFLPKTGGSIVVKHRVEYPRVDDENVSYDGAWASATTFTSSDSDFVSAVDANNIKVGDEVIIRKGKGAGLLCHITAITGTTTKTITIDSGLSITSGNFTFSVEAWKKITFETRGTTRGHFKGSMKDNKQEYSQVKIDIRENYLEELQIITQKQKSLRK